MLSKTQSFLAKNNISNDVAKNYVISNLSNPTAIFNTAKTLSITNDIMADICGVSVPDVVGFWRMNGLDDTQLTPVTTPTTAMYLGRVFEVCNGLDGVNDNINLPNVMSASNGGSGDDTIYGGSKDDYILGGGGNNMLYGGDGNDVIYGRIPTAQTIEQALTEGFNSNNEVGNNYIDGGIGNDKLFGGLVNDTIEGGDGDDTIEGRGGSDSLLGGAGNDNISLQTSQGSTTNSYINGGDGNDTINCNNYKATVDGGSGNDTITYLNGSANGGAGDDLIKAGSGSDTLRGGSGSDTLQGGSGSDTYWISATDIIYAIDSDIKDKDVFIFDNDQIITDVGNIEVYNYRPYIDQFNFNNLSASNHIISITQSSLVYKGKQSTELDVFNDGTNLFQVVLVAQRTNIPETDFVGLS
jgi:Ca2+-binding RTX toxin-like protein